VRFSVRFDGRCDFLPDTELLPFSRIMRFSVRFSVRNGNGKTDTESHTKSHSRFGANTWIGAVGLSAT
jgi:hypothetical protein